MTEAVRRLDYLETPNFEPIGSKFSLSYRIRKGSGPEYLADPPTSLCYYSLSGMTEERPIVSYSIVEYDNTSPYDFIDLVVELSSDQLLRLAPSELDSSFGY